MKIAYVMLYLLNPGAPPELVTQFKLTPEMAMEQCMLSVTNNRPAKVSGEQPNLVCIPVYKPE